MPVVAPETEAREALMTALSATYAEEGFPVRPDRLHASLGDQGTVIGVSPSTTNHARNALVSEMHLLVQFYGSYNKEVRRDQRVDPTVVETFAERFRTTLRGDIDVHSGNNWYFMLERTLYPLDPTGNLTRYEMQIIARGNNTALLETG